MFSNKLTLLVISYAIHLAYTTPDYIDLQSINEINSEFRLGSSNFTSDDDLTGNRSKLDSIDVSTYFEEEETYPLPVKIVLSTLATMTSLITISGNLLVMFSFFLDRQIRNPTNYFILSLSVSDFLIGMFSMPLYTLYLMLNRWPFGEVICNLWLSLDYTACLTSIYTVLFITIDRFCSVKIPAKYRKWRSPNKIILMIAFTWIVPISLFFTSIFAWNYSKKFDPKNCDVAWRSNAAFSLVLMFAYFWSTLSVIIILYIFIYQVAKDLEKKHLDKQTKVNALVGSAPVSRFNKNTLTSDFKTNLNTNLTNVTNLNNNKNINNNNNNNLKIPCTIQEKNTSESKSKCEKKSITNKTNNQPVKQISNNNLNSSYASTASKEDFSSDSDHDLKRQHLRHSNHNQQAISSNNSIASSNKITQRPETLAVVDSNHTDHKQSTQLEQQQEQLQQSIAQPKQESSNNNYKRASNFNPIEIIDDTNQKLIEIPSSSTQPQQIPFIDDEFEELNYVLHRRQFGNEKLPIKEETILIKSPLKNGFFQKISLSIKSFSRRSSQKSLIDISSGNDSNEKTKLEGLGFKKAIDTTHMNGTNEEKNNLLNDKSNKNEKSQENSNEPLADSSKLTEDKNKPQKKLDDQNKENHIDVQNNQPNNQMQIKNDLDKKLSKVGNQTSTMVNTQPIVSKNDLKDTQKKQTKYENRARKALRTITFILGAFVFCFAPYHIVSAFDLFCTFCYSSKLYLHFYNTCYFLCYLNSPINPFMYALANQQFKKTFLRILKGDLRRS